LSVTLILTLISRADWSDKLEWYIVERYIVFYKSGSIKERTQTSAEMGRSRHVVIHDVIHDICGGLQRRAEAVAETNQLSGRGLVLVPGCAVHILGNWLIMSV